MARLFLNQQIEFTIRRMSERADLGPDLPRPTKNISWAEMIIIIYIV